MLHWLIKWLVSAISLLIVAYFVPGFHVVGFPSALIAAVVIGLINGTLGAILKFFTFPLRLLTLGLLTLVINAGMLKFATHFVDGFAIDGWGPAIIGAFLLAIVSGLLNWVTPDFKKKTA
jgi:putative membrane protein